MPRPISRADLLSLPAAGHTWRQTPALSAAICEESSETSCPQARHLDEETHARVTELVARHDGGELFTEHCYPGTGGPTPGSLLTSVTYSHDGRALRTARAICRAL